jgi:hypothetical protein
MKAKGKSKVTGERLAGSICKVCDNRRIRDFRREYRKEKMRAYQMKTQGKRQIRQRYGITMEEKQVMSDAQGGKCLICQQVKPLVVDHCHAALKIRGLLCSNCNSGLGLFKDNPEWLIRAAEYLQTNKPMQIERAGGLLNAI